MDRFLLRHLMTSLVILACLNTYAQDRYSSISNIERHGEWYRVYDETGKQVKTMYARSVGELVGAVSNFFIMRRGAWLDLYDVYCKKYKTLYAPSIGTILSVSSNGFVAQHDNWIITYDRTGRKLNTRYTR